MKGNSLRNKIRFFHTLLILLSIEDIYGLLFFHEHSYFELHAPDSKVDFGFSIAYQANLKSLVIGAPHSSIDGKVYTCPLNEAVKQKKFSCNSIDIDIDKLAGNYSRHDSIEQEFCLGASISATPEYIFTCAPLWTSDFVDGNITKFGALGTCFITNGTYASRYNGLFEQYKPIINDPKIDNIYGGIGWDTLHDPVNKLIIIAKPSLSSSISVMNASDPLKPTKPVKLGASFITYYFLGSFAAGVFFNNYNILYAFGMTTQSNHAGAIGFLYYDTSENEVKILKGTRYNKPIIIEDGLMNTMYGASLHSIDVNGDGYSELLVGAPAQTNDAVMYEHGAVHFYSGGGMAASKSENDLCIYGVEDGSRFGTAIGSTNIDGDGLPEIFISAPYEKSGKGAVYVLSGYMIAKLLKNSAIKLIKVTELTDMQRISNVPYKSFGFSILPVTDFYKNDGKLLAVGSPNDGKVTLYRSIPFINVTVTALLIGKERVKEDDMNFTVTVSVNVTLPPKANDISGRLTVSMNRIGDPAEIVNGTYTIDFTTTGMYTNEILVLLNGTDPGDYKFQVNVESDISRFDKPDYDKSFFMISNYSKSETVLDVVRRCRGNDCVPRLSMRFEPNGTRDVFMLGSRESENITVVVRNDGNVTYESCARIRVTGVKAAVVGCIQTKEEWYKCDLINIERHQERPIYIRLDMSRATNMDQEHGVNIEVFLYNTCAASGVKEAVNDNKKISFNLNTTDISIDYVSYDRNVTLTEIQDTETSPTIDVREFFTITNNGSVTWKSLRALIILETESYLVDKFVITPEDGECNEVSSKNQSKFHCDISLEPKSTLKITILRSLFKEKIMAIFDNDKTTMNSTYTLILAPTSTSLRKTFTTTLYFQMDSTFGSNKYNIIASAVIVALFVLVVIIIILYKVGFFERKEKTKLDALKQEIKKRESIRRPNRDDAAATLQDNDQDNIEVVDDWIPLQLMDSHDTRDLSSLIKN